MMTFMKEFSEEFPLDKYPMDKDAYKDMDKAALSNVNGKLIDQELRTTSQEFSLGIV